MQSEFPRLKALLLEDEGEDVVSGLRRALSLIGTGWSSDYSSIKQEQKKLWRRLSPQQQRHMSITFNQVAEGLFTSPDAKVDLSDFRPSDKNEVKFITATFLAMASSLAEVDAYLLGSKVAKSVLDDADRQAWMKHFDGNLGSYPLANSKLVLDFLTQHQALLKRIVLQFDEEMSFDVKKIYLALLTGLEKTPDDKKKDTVTALHFFLLNMAHSLKTAYEQAPAKFKGLPDSPEEPVTKP